MFSICTVIPLIAKMASFKIVDILFYIRSPRQNCYITVQDTQKYFSGEKLVLLHDSVGNIPFCNFLQSVISTNAPQVHLPALRFIMKPSQYDVG